MTSYNPLKKNTAQRIVFPILDADGDPVTSATTPDTEVSIDGGEFADITDEAHEIATDSGVYYVDLAQAETNGDVIAIQCKCATVGAKTTVLVFYTQSTNLDAVKTETAAIVADTNELQSLISSSKLPAQVKGIDDIDLSATMKTSVTTAANAASNLVLTKQVTVNAWAIVASQLIIYADDGTTPLLTFDLDSATAPTSRTPV